MAKTEFVNKSLPEEEGTIVTQEHMNRLNDHVPTGEDRNGCSPLMYGQDIGAADAYKVDLVFGKKRREGTNTSVSSYKLVDSAATFVTDGVKVGDKVVNVSNRTESTVTVVDSETELSLTNNLFTATGKKYAVGPDILQAPLSLMDGLEIAFEAANDNTGASTLQVNGLTAVALKKDYDRNLEAGDIVAGQVVVVRYDGAAFQMQEVKDRQVRDNSRDLVVNKTNDYILSIIATEIVLHNAAGLSKKASSVSVSANITQSGANGRDTGSEANNFYYAWVIYNPTTDTIAALLSLSKTSPTLPSGYTYKALAGYVYNNSSLNFEEFGTWNGSAFVDFDSYQGVYNVGAGAEQEFTFNPGNLSTRTLFVTVRGGTNENVSWKAISRTTTYYEYMSGGKGTAPADPTPPSLQHRVAIRIRNNHTSAQDIYVKALAIGHK